MISISKPLRNHWKLLVFGVIIVAVSFSGVVVLAYAEGTFSDSAGHLNNPFKVVCDSGVLANRQVFIAEDGEYNWMLANGQSLQIQVSLNTVQNNSLAIYLVQWSQKGAGIYKSGLLNSSTQSVNWSLSIPAAGRWQLEMVDHSGIGVYVNVYAVAGNSGNLGLINCLNPGDLFRND